MFKLEGQKVVLLLKVIMCINLGESLQEAVSTHSIHSKAKPSLTPTSKHEYNKRSTYNHSMCEPISITIHFFDSLHFLTFDLFFKL